MILERIERSIQYCAEISGDYPDYVMINKDTYEKLKEEMIRDFKKGMTVQEKEKVKNNDKLLLKMIDFTKIRGLKIKINEGISNSNVIVDYEINETERKTGYGK